MRKLVRCPKCGHDFVQLLPDVTPLEAEQLRDANDDSGVIIKCPHCQERIHRRRSDLPDLPEPP